MSCAVIEGCVCCSSSGLHSQNLFLRQYGKHVIVLRPSAVGFLEEENVVSDLTNPGRLVSRPVGEGFDDFVFVFDIVPMMRAVVETSDVDPLLAFSR